MNNQRGSALAIISVVVVLVFIGMLGYVWYSNQVEQPAGSQNTPVKAADPSDIPSAAIDPSTRQTGR